VVGICEIVFKCIQDSGYFIAPVNFWNWSCVREVLAGKDEARISKSNVGHLKQNKIVNFLP
jgi:hypothetical protein